MPDPVWLDNGVLDNALKGDAAINQQLVGYRKAGRPLLVVPAVEQELLNGNVVTGTSAPAPDFRKAMQQGMIKLGVKVDTLAGKLPPNTRLKDLYTIGADNVSYSDRRVLNQIRASAQARGIAAPEMITTETGNKAMVSQSPKWGIRPVQAARPAPGSVPAPPRVVLAEDAYPAERKGPISRFFRDRPILKKLGVIGAGVAVQMIKDAIFKAIKDHFSAVLQDAWKELDSRYPDPRQLTANGSLERYRQAYLAAASRLTAPSGVRLAEALILAVTPNRDIAKTKKYLDDQLSKVQSAADGTRSGYAKVTDEYIDAMLALYTQLNAYSALVEIGADVHKRGAILVSIGRDLEQEFLRCEQMIPPHPVAHLMWMDVQIVGKDFQSLGGFILSFASEIQARYALALSMQKQLDEELIRVSEALAQVAP